MNNTADLQPLKLYTLTEIEPIIGVSHRTLLTYVKEGRLKASKVGGKWRVTQGAIKELIEISKAG